MAKKVFGIILNILIVVAVVIIILVLYSVIQTKMLKKDYVNFFGYTVFQVATGSMSPTMEVKDIIIAKVLDEEKAKDLKVDDIIVYKQEQSMITHRIVKIENDTITAKGDANNAEDNPIKTSDVIGEVKKTIQNVGIWQQVFAEPRVYISIFITITLWAIMLLYRPEEKKDTSGEKANEENKKE